MALAHVSKLFGTTDCRIAKLTADPAGGTATYASSIDVVGIKSVVLGGDIEVKELRGDHTLLDSDSTLTNITVTFNYAKLGLDAIAVMLGGAVADSGSTPNQIAKWSLLSTDTLFHNFKFTAKVYSTDFAGGDAIIELYKCKISSFPEMGTEEEDYQLFSQEATVVPRLADSKWIDVSFRETTAALS